MKETYAELSSEALMPLVASGDRMAFACLMTRHKDSVFRIAYKFVSNKEEADDLTQEVFLRVWRFSGQYNPLAKFSTWLYTITANACKSELQSLWRRHIRLIGSFWSSDNDTFDNAPATYTPSSEDTVIQAQQSRQVLAAIHSLPHNQRLALLLRRYEELPYQEIAEVLGCSVASVESLLFRAKSALQKKLSHMES